jgi:tRNA (cytidine/uridine-2'-O-)-methyltransferase
MPIMRLALFQPDIPQNAGTLLRLAACLDVPVDLIEPLGFVFGGRHIRRAGMDYLDMVKLERHASWQRFLAARQPGARLLLLTTKGDVPYTSCDYRPGDVLIAGRETSGVPDEVHAAADRRLIIPMVPGLRSINVAIATAMVLGEALRQTGGFPAAGVPGLERSS